MLFVITSKMFRTFKDTLSYVAGLNHGPGHQEISPGFALPFPGEIRNAIYEHLLIFSEPIVIYTPKCTSWPPTYGRTFAQVFPPSIDLAILAVSKKTYCEASFILYSKNCFMLQELHDMHRSYWVDLPDQVYTIRSFARAIGSKNASLIGHVCIAFPLQWTALIPPSNARRTLQKVPNALQKSFPNLAVVELWLNQHGETSLASPSLTAFQDMQEMVRILNDRFETNPILQRIVLKAFMPGLVIAANQLIEGKPKWRYNQADLPEYHYTSWQGGLGISLSRLIRLLFS